jgi:hypothetical protein
LEQLCILCSTAPAAATRTHVCKFVTSGLAAVVAVHIIIGSSQPNARHPAHISIKFRVFKTASARRGQSRLPDVACACDICHRRNGIFFKQQILQRWRQQQQQQQLYNAFNLMLPNLYRHPILLSAFRHQLRAPPNNSRRPAALAAHFSFATTRTCWCVLV